MGCKLCLDIVPNPYPRSQSMAGQSKKNLSSQERKRLRRIILLLLFVTALFLLFIPGRSFLSYRNMQQQVSALSRDNERLEERNRELATEIKRLQNDEAYLEELARKKHGLLKENEIVYEFKPGKKKKD